MAKKQYGAADNYERKLERVMERLGVDSYNFNWDRFLGFEQIPSGQEEVRARYRTLAKQMHPDAGGRQEDFEALKRAAEQGMQYFGRVKDVKARQLDDHHCG